MCSEESLPMKIPEDHHWELILEDWKQAKDRIMQFDHIVVRIRISGITLILLISGVGLTLSEKLQGPPVPLLNCNLTALPFIFAMVFTIAILIFDWVHYQMLLMAVNHAKEIEDTECFQGLLRITHKLTTQSIGNMHFFSMILLYVVLFILNALLAWYFLSIPPLGIS